MDSCAQLRLIHAARGVAALLCTVAGTLLGACSNGNQDEAFREPPPTLMQDIVPSGTRIDVRSDNYFPMSAGDSWTYDQIQFGAPTGVPATRVVVTGPDSAGNLVLRETLLGALQDISYRVAADGLLRTDLLGTAVPPGVTQIVGSVVEYPQPFYAVGETRRAIRQGAWDQDLDGDGHPEGFRVEFIQVFQGFESLQLPSGALQTARFSNTLVTTFTPSKLSRPVVTTTIAESTWFASNIGLVHSERSVSTSDGSVPFSPYTLRIRGGTVSGRTLFTTTPDGTVVNVPLVHSALVYDSVHNRYYASIPGSVPVRGNSIATIDPQTGAVTYSGPIGSDPGPLGLSADGSVLYVGLKGAGAVIKLSVPSMTVLGSITLPLASFFGQLFAESLAVSPVDPTVLAVSMYRAGTTPRHDHVALIRDMALQPVVPSGFDINNVLAFGATGTEVFGLDVETSEFGLRRLGVLGNGLAEQQLVSDAIASFGLQSFELRATTLVIGQRVYRTSDLMLLGTVSAAGGGCRILPMGTRVACLDSTFISNEIRLVVADLATFVVQSRPLVAVGPPTSLSLQVVPGPTGQVAVRDNAAFAQQSTQLLLFTSPLLQ